MNDGKNSGDDDKNTPANRKPGMLEIVLLSLAKVLEIHVIDIMP